MFDVFHFFFQKAILELLYELLGLPQPTWTEDYSVALQSVDPSDFQVSFSKYFLCLFY